MSKKRLFLGGVSLSLALAACGQQPVTQATGATATGATQSSMTAQSLSSSARYIVVFKNAAVPADVKQRVAQAGGKLRKQVDGVGIVTATGNADFARKIAADSSVLAVGREHFYTLPTLAADVNAVPASAASDTFDADQWDMRRIGAQIGAERVGSKQANVLVGVLDTGVMDNHPDLQGQVAYTAGTNYCAERGGPNNSPAYPIYSTYINLDNPDWQPSDGCTQAPTISYEAHGTHVAGTIAGNQGGGDITGVAPQAKIAAYKVFDRYRYTDAQGKIVDDVGGFDGPIFDAIVDAANRGVAVINMSLGGTLDRSNQDDNASWLAWQRVVDYATRKGTLIIASAGNASENSNGNIAHIPSDLSSVMSVSATGVTQLRANEAGNLVAAGPDVLAFYSKFGASTDIAAPGGDCGTNPANGQTWCALPRKQRPADWYKHLILSSVINNDGSAGYAYYAGTSMASPHVAGVAALVKAQHPEYNANQLRAHLKRTAEQVGQKQEFGSGLVNADLATR